MMGEIICPVTKKKFDCQKCTAVAVKKYCPYWKFDQAVEDTIKLIRKLVEQEVRDENGARKLGGQ